MSNVDKNEGMTSSNLNNRKGCPCCAFDLFLPPSLLDDASDNNNETSKNTTTLQGLELPVPPHEVVSIVVSSGKDLLIVDTHGHAQLERDRDEAYNTTLSNSNITDKTRIALKSITCAVSPSDWKATLEFAAQSENTLPALGVHPWYLEGLEENWLQKLEVLLQEHESAIVGEIGLCKMAKFVRHHPEGKAVALAIQRSVFQQQMTLATKLRRPVSVHCVSQHGVFVSVVKELMTAADTDSSSPTTALPPAIGMHSFTGTAHHVKELLNLEKQFSPGKPLFYFGFSHSVNYAMCTSDKSRRKGREAVRAVPEDRLMVESDVHSSDDLLVGTAGAIAYVAWARNESILGIAEVTSRNGMAFIASVAQ